MIRVPLRAAVLTLAVALGGCNSSTASEGAPNKQDAAQAAAAGQDSEKPAEKEAKPEEPAKQAPRDPITATAPIPIERGAPGSCESASLQLEPATVIAKIDGKDVTIADLGDDYGQAVDKALATYCNEIYRLRQAALTRAVEDAALASAAAKAGSADKDTYLREQLSERMTPPSVEAQRAFYDKNKREGAPAFEAVQKQVEGAMMEDVSKQAYASLIGELKQHLEVQPLLPDVRPPPVDMGSPEHAPAFGPADATVELVEFSDFECPYCARAAEAVSEVKKKYGDRVKFSFRHFPLSFHANAKPASQYAHCANEQEKFWPLHDEIFANQKGLAGEGLKTAAEKAGLDMEKLQACLSSGRADEAIAEDMKKGGEVGVQGTPSFFINGRPFEGGISAEALGEAIEAAMG